MDYVKIFGKLTDFNGTVIANGSVEIKKEDMQNYAYITKTDDNGYYSINVKKGDYTAIAAVKDYIDEKLEYWGWNLPAYEDMEVNMRIDKLEIYAINAFMIQRSRPNNSIMIYFRPMSLIYYKKMQNDINKDNKTLLDIAPTLSKNEIIVSVNESTSEILEFTKVKEMAIDNGKEITGYLLQIPMDGINDAKDYQKIHIVVCSVETGEKGEGSLFWKIPDAFKLK
jgi:hypothetical protein